MNLAADRFMSDVEKNKELLSVGDRLLTAGDYVVVIKEIHLDEDYFVAVDVQTGEDDYFCFDNLQLHWYILGGAKNYDQMTFRTV